MHNIKKNTESEKESKKIYEILKCIVKYSKKLKLILMTATPVYDKAIEIIDILNLLLLNDNKRPLKKRDIFKKDNNEYILTEEGEKILIEKTKGYISYLKGNDPYSFPIVLEPNDAKIPDVKYDNKEQKIINKIKYTKLVSCPMKNEQLNYYINYIKNINKNNKSNLKRLLDINNIVFPTNNKKVLPYEKKLITENETIDSAFYKEKIKTPITTYYRFKYSKNSIINNKPFLDESIIENYSSKLKKILDTLSKSRGLSIIFSRYVWNGVIPIALALEQNGYMRYTSEGEDQLLDNKYKDTKKYRCYFCDKFINNEVHSDEKHKDYHEFKIAKYIIQTSSIQELIKSDLNNSVKKFSAIENKEGKNIKIFIATELIKEGIDFKNIRQLYLFDTWYNKAWYDQIIGRAVRFCSHINLEEEYRNVLIYNLAASLSNSKDKTYKYIESDDEKRYRISETKDFNNKKVIHILKRTAVDCLNNKNKNILLSKKKIIQYNSIGDKINFNFNEINKPYSSECDYLRDCKYECIWEPKSNKIEIDSNTYEIFFDKLIIQDIVKIIDKIYKFNYVYTIEDIVKYINKYDSNINKSFIYKTIDYMINKKVEITDKYRRKGYIIYRGRYYIYQPNDLKDELLPMYYRKRLLQYKDKMIKIDLFNDNNINNIKNNEKESKNINYNKKLINKILNNIKINFKLFTHLEKYDITKNKKYYNYSVIQNILIHLKLNDKIIFYKYIIKFFIENKKIDEITNKKINYLDKDLIKYDRELSEKFKKNVNKNINGFRIQNIYYSYLNKKWYKSKDLVINKVKMYEKYLKLKDIRKNKTKNKIIGSFIKNKNNIIIFQIKDYLLYKNVFTQEDKVSKKSIITGRTCITLSISKLLEFNKVLGISDNKVKKNKKFICNQLEIFLYIKHLNNNDNILWFEENLD